MNVLRGGTTAEPTITIKYHPSPELDELIDEVFGLDGAHRNGSVWAITRRNRLAAFCSAARRAGHYIHSGNHRQEVPREHRRRQR